MLQTIFSSVGVSQRPRMSSTLENIIVYASKSNIILVNTNKTTRIILRESENEITFLRTEDSKIIICDVKGNLEIYDINFSDNFTFFNYRLVSCVNAECPLYFGTYFDNDHYVCVGVHEIIFMKQNKILYTKKVENTITSFEKVFIDQFYFVIGLDDGNIQIMTKDEDIYKKCIHNDAIRCIKYKKTVVYHYLLTSSLDETIKVWRIRQIDNEIKLKHLDTLLGHRRWTYDCNWINSSDILSCSVDNSIIHWKNVNNSWGIKKKLGGLTEKMQGFYNAFMINGDIFAQSSTGGFYRYERKTNKLLKFITGHNNTINKIDVEEDFILTASSDSTTRIFSIELLEEIARPQIHGYGIVTAKFLKKKCLEFISGGQESIMRVFKPSDLVLENYKNIITPHLENKYFSSIDENKESDLSPEGSYENIPLAFTIAKTSELSLTNEVTTQKNEELMIEGNTERNLSLNFLFIEKNKVYGHFFDTADISVSEKYIISANKSTTKKHAGIFVWNTNFEKVDYIEEHEYGIEALNFSNDGQYFISCSRDMKVCIFQLLNDTFSCVKRFFEHTRTVADCTFSYDNKFAASVGKDKKLIIYDIENMNVVFKEEKTQSLTSLAFSVDDYVLAIGDEKGFIEIMKIDDGVLSPLFRRRYHAGTVKSLKFHQNKMLISAGTDGLLNVMKY